MNAPRLPLRIDSGPFGRDRAVLDADGRQLAFIACHSHSTARTAEEGQQIAATIVRTVNAHDQLVAALRDAVGVVGLPIHPNDAMALRAQWHNLLADLHAAARPDRAAASRGSRAPVNGAD